MLELVENDFKAPILIIVKDVKEDNNRNEWKDVSRELEALV